MVFPANARALMLPPSGRGVLLGDDRYSLPVVGEARHRAAIDKLLSGGKLRCTALLTREGRDYDPHGVMVTVRGQEIGFLPWMEGYDFREELRAAGFLEAVCKAEITGEHVIGDSWGFVGVAIDASLPFTFMSAEEWYNQRTSTDERELAVRGSHRKIASVIQTLRQSFLNASSLPDLRKTGWTRLPRSTDSQISPPRKPAAGTLPRQPASRSPNANARSSRDQN
jgi:hypothetical protein